MWDPSRFQILYIHTTKLPRSVVRASLRRWEGLEGTKLSIPGLRWRFLVPKTDLGKESEGHRIMSNNNNVYIYLWDKQVRVNSFPELNKSAPPQCGPGARPEGRRESGGQGFWGVKNGRKRDTAAGGDRAGQVIGALDPDSCELCLHFYKGEAHVAVATGRTASDCVSPFHARQTNNPRCHLVGGNLCPSGRLRRENTEKFTSLCHSAAWMDR